MIVSADLGIRQIAIYSLIWVIYGVINPTTMRVKGGGSLHTYVGINQI